MSNIINASLYNMDDAITFTQTFKQGSSTLNSQSFITNVIRYGELKFEAIYDKAPEYNDLGTAIPTITLTLSKP